MSSTILFCGGGSMGHITPSLAVAQALRSAHPSARPVFVCSNRTEEIDVLHRAGVQYRTVHAGKFPRGLSLRIFSFPILFIASFFRSLRIIAREKPSLVFSKGGYVSVPVCLAAFMKRVPVILHVSDSVPSLSDRLIGRIAKRICTGFPVDTLPTSLRAKAVQTGHPVRPMILEGSRAAGQRITGFSGRRPVLLVTGGSQGSVALNEAIEQHFKHLIDLADIIHITGEGKSTSIVHARYVTRTYAHDEMPHFYALADVAVTRAGAGTLAELGALKKPAIVVPLEGVAHDHQVRNAERLAAAGAVEHLPQEALAELPERIAALLKDAARLARLGTALHAVFPSDAAKKTAAAILDVLVSSPIQS